MFKNTSTFFNSFILEHHGCTLGTSRKELITINMFAVATVDFGKSENRFGPVRLGFARIHSGRFYQNKMSENL